MKRRRQTLGKKTYMVLMSNIEDVHQGDVYIEMPAYSAEAAKQFAERMYSREGWFARSARATKGQE